jgi:hypothetical protein
VHKESISTAVLNFAGKVAMECVIDTKASSILQFIYGPRAMGSGIYDKPFSKKISW